MAISNFIPTVWSETLLNELDTQYVAVRNCNREFEGDIKDKGSVVKIGSIGAITVFDYTKDTDMRAPQALSDTAVSLTIDKAKAFNFQIDDIDRVQSQPKLMKAALRKAASALADAADKHIFNMALLLDDDKIISAGTVDETTIIKWIATARKTLMAIRQIDHIYIIFLHPTVFYLLYSHFNPF